jgi:hypothetical protein
LQRNGVHECPLNIEDAYDRLYNAHTKLDIEYGNNVSAEAKFQQPGIDVLPRGRNPLVRALAGLAAKMPFASATLRITGSKRGRLRLPPLGSDLPRLRKFGSAPFRLECRERG